MFEFTRISLNLGMIQTILFPLEDARLVAAIEIYLPPPSTPVVPSNTFIPNFRKQELP